MTNLYRFAETESASGAAALGIDPKAFAIQLITFVFVFLILKKFAFDKIVELLEKRRKTIEEGVRLTSKLAAEKEKLEKDIEAAHQKARKRSDEVIAAAQVQAGSIIKEAEDSAQRKIDAMLEDAHKKIEEETIRARQNLEKDVAELVILATETVARTKLDGKKDQELIKHALRGGK